LGRKIRYSHNGLVIDKKYAYLKGARPVVYEEITLGKEILPTSEWWRLVPLDLSNPTSIVDWSHEREWRVSGDFHFELSEVFIILGDAGSFKEFVKKVPQNILEAIGGITAIKPIVR